MITTRLHPLFSISIIVLMSLVDVFGGVLLGSHQNSAAGLPPYTTDVPNPFTHPEEMPFSPYTMYTDDPRRPEYVPVPEHVPVPETEPEIAPGHPGPGHKHEPHAPRTKRLAISHHQAESNQSHKTHLQHTESNIQREPKTESRSPLVHNSEAHSQLGQNHSQIHHHYTDPLLHPVPHRHLRKFRVRMPSRTPLNVRRIFTFLNMRITQKLLFENLHLVRKKAA